MQSVLRAIARQRLDGQQGVARDGQVLSRRRVHVVFGEAARHDHVEGIVAAKEKDADQRLIVGECRIAADQLGAHGARHMGEAHARHTQSGIHQETSAIECAHDPGYLIAAYSGEVAIRNKASATRNVGLLSGAREAIVTACAFTAWELRPPVNFSSMRSTMAMGVPESCCSAAMSM
jgi:hypothetical protein